MDKLEIIFTAQVSLQVFYFQDTYLLIALYFNSAIVYQALVSFEALCA